MIMTLNDHDSIVKITENLKKTPLNLKISLIFFSHLLKCKVVHMKTR